MKQKNWLNFTLPDCVQVLNISVPVDADFMPSFMVTLRDEKKRTMAAYNHDVSIENFEDNVKLIEYLDANKEFEAEELLTALL